MRKILIALGLAVIVVVLGAAIFLATSTLISIVQPCSQSSKHG